MHTIIKDKGLDDLEGLQIEIADDFEKVSCTGFLSKFKHFQLLGKSSCVFLGTSRR